MPCYEFLRETSNEGLDTSSAYKNTQTIAPFSVQELFLEILSLARRSASVVRAYILELNRKLGISRATYFNWQAKYGGVSVSQLKRMKGLAAENAKKSGADITQARRFSASPTR